MPAAVIDGRLQTKCEDCGGPANFGADVYLMKAMQAKAAGNLPAAKQYLGKWYCGTSNGNPRCKRR